jgi:hypothetical protein
MHHQTINSIRKYCKTAFLLLVALTAATPGSLFAEESASQEYRVKAAFLYNFILFVEWPAEAFARSDSPLTICILGKSPFSDALDSLRDKTVKKRKLMVQQISTVQEIGSCQVLFISASEKMHLLTILAAVKNQNVLTVSDLERFTQAGGIINFVALDDKVRFEINLKAAQQSRIKISSQLLKLARDVIE